MTASSLMLGSRSPSYTVWCAPPHGLSQSQEGSSHISQYHQDTSRLAGGLSPVSQCDNPEHKDCGHKHGTWMH